MTTTDERTWTATMPPAISAACAIDLVKTYGKGDAVVRALGAINIEFSSGSFTAVMGPSGSGKSTLLHGIPAVQVCCERKTRSAMKEGARSCQPVSMSGTTFTTNARPYWIYLTR